MNKNTVYRIHEQIKQLQGSIYIDMGQEDASVIVAGMGRSGTTWVANAINYDKSYRVLFEPFHPNVVKAAKHFEYNQYINPDCKDHILIEQARKILSGRLGRSRWVDRENRRLLYNRRIIKDIRCNLMLRWLKEVYPQIPIVLVVRHPLSVAASWLSLGWGKEHKGQRCDFDIITSQKTLLNDFPVIADIAKEIDRNDIFEKIVFIWSVSHFVPFKQFSQNEGEMLCLCYENLILDQKSELERLFRYLGKPYNLDVVVNDMRSPSSTNFLKRDFKKEGNQLLVGWKTKFSEEQKEKAGNILSMFELQDIYKVDGYPTRNGPFVK